MLDKARRILVCEISEVMSETRSAAEEQVDQALKARKIGSISETPNSPVSGKLSQDL